MTVLLDGPPARADLPSVDCRLLRSRAIRVLRELKHSRSELSIALVDDAAIKDLNTRYRNRSRPTDVLAFALREGPEPERSGNLLGDVVISVETALRQARKAHRGIDREIAHLLIHGTLHLLGHDHQDDAEARVMRAEERRLRYAIEL